MSAAAFYLAKTLEARERGSLPDCLHYSSVAQHHAERDREPDVGWRALTALGMLHLGRGEPEKARPWFGMALEHAKAHGLTRRIAGSAHDLYVCAVEADDAKTAAHWQPLALELYPPRDPRVAVLLSDFALARLRKGEDASYARLLWKPVHDAPTSDARTRLIAATWMIFAAAHARVPQHYADALCKLSRAVEHAPHGEYVAVSLNRAVEAMLAYGDCERAYLLAESAELAATTRGEDVLRERAGYLRTEAERGRKVKVSA